MLSQALAISVLAAVAAAQQAAYQQCGGKGYTGGTTCVSGWTCTYSNDYYSQCLPGSGGGGGGGGASSTLKTTTVATTTKTTTAATTTKGTTATTPAGTKTTTSGAAATTTAGSGSGSGSGNAAGNPFYGNQVYANPYYASEVSSLAVPQLTAPWSTKATAVAKIGSFTWLDTLAKVPTMDTYLADIKAKNAAGASPPNIGAFVVYDLPDRDCAALASNGELSIANGGAAKYQEYINSIAAIIKKYPETTIALVVEPDSLGNLVTNMNVQKCANAASTYKTSVEYAIKTLNFPNVAMYLDAGHAGWLGWAANIGPAADLFAEVFKAAGSPAAVRGLATNVANYNAWSIATCPSYTQGDANCDEKRYVNALAPLLTAKGFPAHFITDTSRNGVQPTKQLAWGDWCNVIGTGFGVRPGTNTGDALLDAFAWVKPGGECDGTSNTTAVRYDSHCGLADALQPAPEAGTWFQAYFEQLLKNANPAF